MVSLDDSAYIAQIAKKHYDAEVSQAFYALWGGEFINVAVYDNVDKKELKSPTPQTINNASLETSKCFIEALPNSEHIRGGQVVDMGAGYGGTARWIAQTYDCNVHCVEISEKECARNRQLTEASNLAHKVNIIQGSFTQVPLPDSSVDLVISQDCFVHTNLSLFKEAVVEANRLLKPFGFFLFTDIIKRDHCKKEEIANVHDRFHIQEMGSPTSYLEILVNQGFEIWKVDVDNKQISQHYQMVLDVVNSNQDKFNGLDPMYVERVYDGLRSMVCAGERNLIAHGLFLAQKPSS
eukprot:TRINITY_DN6876_c1_g2_i1.p2 TRINITY_DN6876_c1_g2~~TRINITY_DN6876_c1_g2_i1.p2  ORF type:complete len:294 (-),score=21.87 TRINITY_DN6876_c1_g2_i1:108-989(-)